MEFDTEEEARAWAENLLSAFSLDGAANEEFAPRAHGFYAPEPPFWMCRWKPQLVYEPATEEPVLLQPEPAMYWSPDCACQPEDVKKPVKQYPGCFSSIPQPKHQHVYFFMAHESGAVRVLAGGQATCVLPTQAMLQTYSWLHGPGQEMFTDEPYEAQQRPRIVQYGEIGMVAYTRHGSAGWVRAFAARDVAERVRFGDLLNPEWYRDVLPRKTLADADTAWMVELPIRTADVLHGMLTDLGASPWQVPPDEFSHYVDEPWKQDVPAGLLDAFTHEHRAEHIRAYLSFPYERHNESSNTIREAFYRNDAQHHALLLICDEEIVVFDFTGQQFLKLGAPGSHNQIETNSFMYANSHGEGGFTPSTNLEELRKQVKRFIVRCRSEWGELEQTGNEDLEASKGVSSDSSLDWQTACT